MLKKSDVKALCESSTYSDAVALCSEENICNVQKTIIDENTTKIQGLVQGNFNYFHQVRLTLNRHKNHIVSGYSCDCYAQTRLKNTPCHHCVALALYVVDEEEIEMPAAEAAADETLPADWVDRILAGLKTPEAEQTPAPAEEEKRDGIEIRLEGLEELGK